MHSHHSHSGQYCTHALGDLEECIQEAIRQEFDMLCLTEHIPRYHQEDLYPGEEIHGEKATMAKLLDMFKQYHAHARQLQRKYASSIEILVGCESEMIRMNDLDRLENLTKEYPVDLMVGSVHHVNSIPIDFDVATWKKALATCPGEEAFYGRYFDHQYEVFKRFKPLIIGHFDVILLFAPEHTDLLHWSSIKSKILRNINYVVNYGGLFELNSAAFRKGWSSAYPKPDIVNLIKSAGGQFCLSDDSHGPHQIGLNYHRMQEYLKEMAMTKLGRLKSTRTVYVNAETEDDDGQVRKMKVEAEVKEDYLRQFLQWQAKTPAATA